MNAKSARKSMSYSTLERIKHSFKESDKKNTCKVLVVDDQELYRSGISATLNKQSFDVASAECGFKAIEVLTFFPADVVIIDCNIPGLNSFQCCEYILKIDPSITVIFTCPLYSSELSIEAFKAGGKDILEKPLDENTLFETIDYYIDTK